MGEHGVSRDTIRKAVGILRDEGPLSPCRERLIRGRALTPGPARTRSRRPGHVQSLGLNVITAPATEGGGDRADGTPDRQQAPLLRVGSWGLGLPSLLGLRPGPAEAARPGGGRPGPPGPAGNSPESGPLPGGFLTRCR